MRLASLLLAHDGCNRSFGEIGISEGHHSLSHHRNEQDMIRKVAQIDRFYVAWLAEFLQLLESKQDADGNSILHNSMIVFPSIHMQATHRQKAPSIGVCSVRLD